jgi:predicted DNA-binding protein with PD1-like motif
MTECQRITSREVFMGRLSCGCDLLQELTKIATEQCVSLGRIEAIGAVRQARIGFYDQKSSLYRYSSFDEPLEISKLIGNISLKDGIPFVHAHVTLADGSGKAYGGHLAEGTTVFACEFLLEAFDGPVFQRDFDEETGLFLWSPEKKHP